ncbi:MAG: hypothetical protein NY202_03360 [Mollicutes bacterium UO1]
MEEKERDYSARVGNLENHANLLLSQELSPTELIEELNRLKLLFNNAKLPNTYGLLKEICQQLLNISQFFDSGDYEGMPSRPSSRSSSPIGEDWEKIKQLKNDVKY